MRRIKLRQQPKLIGIHKKLDRREAKRELKALSAAHLERSIEKELLDRLKSKAYGDAPLNVNEDVWKALLEKESGMHEELEDDISADELEEEELEDEDDQWGDREFVSDVSGDEDSDDGLSDLEDAADGDNSDAPTLGKRKPSAAQPKRPGKKPKSNGSSLSPKSFHLLTISISWKLRTSRGGGGSRDGKYTIIQRSGCQLVVFIW